MSVTDLNLTHLQLIVSMFFNASEVEKNQIALDEIEALIKQTTNNNQEPTINTWNVDSNKLYLLQELESLLGVKRKKKKVHWHKDLVNIKEFEVY